MPGEQITLRRDDPPSTRPAQLLAVEDRSVLLLDPLSGKRQRYSRWLGHRYFSVKPWPWYISLEDLARINGPAVDPYTKGTLYFKFS